MPVNRSSKNPLIQPEDIKPSRDDVEVIGVFNAGVTRFKDEVILLLRVAEMPIADRPDIVYAGIYDVQKGRIILKEFSKENPDIDFSDPRLIITPTETYLTSISHLRLARSTDGIDFTIDENPTVTAQTSYETFGLEDPRITLIDGIYYINYVGVSPAGVTTCLISTKDFENYKHHGVIFYPDNKDIVFFPEQIAGKYYALHRPVSSLFKKNDIWIAESPDLQNWGNHRRLMGPKAGSWDSVKIGASAVPFKIDSSWLEVYHGVDTKNRYCLGAVLFDASEPWKINARTAKPIFEPQTAYECDGFFGNVVFTCGLLYEEEKLKIYYGAADTSICYAEIDIEDVLKNLNI